MENLVQHFDSRRKMVPGGNGRKQFLVKEDSIKGAVGKVGKRSAPIDNLGFQAKDYPVLGKFGTEQVRQAL